MGGTPKEEQVPRDLRAQRPLRGKGLVLLGKDVGDDVHLPLDVNCPDGDLQLDDELEYPFCLLPEGAGAWPPPPC